MFKIVNRRVVPEVKFSEHMTVEEAIKKSILKTEFVYNNIEKISSDGGSKTCALCAINKTYYNSYSCYSTNCIKCPISRRTGRPYCFGTPYTAMGLALASKKMSTKFRLEAVQAQIDFLNKVLVRYLAGTL